MDSIKYQQIKKNKKKKHNLTTSARNLVMGHVWSFQQDIQQQTSKLKPKWVTVCGLIDFHSIFFSYYGSHWDQ